MNVGAALVERARAAGASSLAVVGTSKNAGKTVAVGAVADALFRAGTRVGLCSIGRDGESADALDGAPKPRFYLREGTTIATAASLLPRSPALEILARTGETSAIGPIVLARLRAPGFVELAGPPSADALRRVVRALFALGSEFVVIDGAVDRIAALRDGDDAIVAAVGAAGAPTQARAVEDVQALVARLRLRAFDPRREAIVLEGALTAAAAAAFARVGERRQIVVRDGTRVAFGGRALLTLSGQLDLRCERELRPVACTIASIGREHDFEPRSFLQAVAARTGLPAFDVYAGAVAW
ncbi:MAG: hypothetical protein ACLPSH_20865 [Vulcanimicrobiaceae bacterium]